MDLYQIWFTGSHGRIFAKCNWFRGGFHFCRGSKIHHLPLTWTVAVKTACDDIDSTICSIDSYDKTSSSDVAEKPRDASCLSVGSIVQYVERKFRFRFTVVCKIKFCFLLFVVGVHSGCE